MTDGLWILPLIVLLVGGCASTEDQAASEKDAALPLGRLQQMAAERYGATADVDILPNALGTYVLVRHQRPETPEQPVAATSYFVVALAADTLSVEERSLPGTVTWADPKHLRVRLIPGTVPVTGRAPEGYLVDVRTGQRRADGGE
jgi:hypothetical protein